MIINGNPKMPIKDISQKRLFLSKFLLVLKKKWFNSHEFLVSTFMSDMKYRYPKSKYKSNFYSFNNQLDYALTYYFTKLETIKKNVNKFLINSFIISFTKNMFYKNADKQIKKLLKISQDILKNKKIKYKFDIKNNIYGIIR